MYIIIGGGGDVGYYLAKNLLQRGHEVLLLEKDASRSLSLSEELDQGVVMRGDACEARIMDEAGAKRASIVIAVTGDDEDNLVICQMAKKRFNVGRTMARLNNPKHETLFHTLGIDVTVSPTRSILSQIESELPGAHFVNLMTLRRVGLEIVELSIPATSPAVGKTLNQINLSRRCTLVLILRNNEPIFPSAETVMEVNDEVYAVVTREGEEELRHKFDTV